MPESAGRATLRALRDLVQTMAVMAPRRVAATIALTFMAGLLEGVGLLALPWYAHAEFAPLGDAAEARKNATCPGRYRLLSLREAPRSILCGFVKCRDVSHWT